MGIDVRDGQTVLTVEGSYKTLTLEHDERRSYDEIEAAFNARGYPLIIGLKAHSGHRAWILGAKSMSTQDVAVETERFCASREKDENHG